MSFNSAFKIFLLLCSCLFLPNYGTAAIKVFSAVSSYNNIAQQIGGEYVSVDQISYAQNQDPHHLIPKASTLKAIADADVVIVNGLMQDKWLQKFLQNHPATHPQYVIYVDKLEPPPIDDPHLWFDFKLMQKLAEKIALNFSKIKPEHNLKFSQNLHAFQQQISRIDTKIAEFNKKHPDLKVAASESLFNNMLQYTKCNIYGAAVQRAFLADSEPNARVIARFLYVLENKMVQLLIQNKDLHSSLITSFAEHAKENNIPVVNLSEYQPSNINYADWILSYLAAIDLALKAHD